MKLLLDTCTFLWIAEDSPKLSRKARALILDPDNELYLSVASAWEIAVKSAAGRLLLPEPPDRYVPSRRAMNGIEALPLEEVQALYAHKLPLHHTDPFDRILVCQATFHDLTILSPDAAFSKYRVRVVW